MHIIFNYVDNSFWGDLPIVMPYLFWRIGMRNSMSNYFKWMCYECNLLMRNQSDTCCFCIKCGEQMHFMEKVTDDYVMDPEATSISC